MGVRTIVGAQKGSREAQAAAAEAAEQAQLQHQAQQDKGLGEQAHAGPFRRLSFLAFSQIQ